MADRALVAVFDTENQAYDAAKELQDLSEREVITVKHGAIVTKDVPAGAIVAGPAATVRGMVSGVTPGSLADLGVPATVIGSVER